MSSNPPCNLHPVMVVEDRYQGVYSGGSWWAIAQGDVWFEGRTRIDWLMENGPGSDDVTASVFWAHAPPWIAAAATPDEAIAKLMGQSGAADDDWSPPPIEADPRWREALRPRMPR